MADPSRLKSVSPEPPVLDSGILGRFVLAVSGLIPSLESIKVKIEESSGKIPKASNQLTSVTAATESATMEILTVLDSMSQNVDEAEVGVKTLRSLLPNAAPSVAEVMEAISQSLATTKEKSMNIAMALQVQDITSQQIAGVSHMIESVRQELTHILNEFDGTSSQSPVIRLAQPKHFDNDAEFERGLEVIVAGLGSVVPTRGGPLT